MTLSHWPRAALGECPHGLLFNRGEPAGRGSPEQSKNLSAWSEKLSAFSTEARKSSAAFGLAPPRCDDLLEPSISKGFLIYGRATGIHNQIECPAHSGVGGNS